jgi:hypothetical protein
MTITVKIESPSGEIIGKSAERYIPDIPEIDKQGFRIFFDEIETAVLESRKEVSDAAVSEYLSRISQKKHLNSKCAQGKHGN